MKSNLKQIDFENSMQHSRIDEKVVKNIFLKFEKVLPEWKAFINISFLSEWKREIEPIELHL